MEIRRETPDRRTDPQGNVLHIGNYGLGKPTQQLAISVKMVSSNKNHQFDRPHLVISVADSGEGITPEHLRHVFERFYRVEDSRSRSEGGSGLGLAIVKQMVKAHGGRVWAESEVGRGSIFYIALPL